MADSNYTSYYNANDADIDASEKTKDTAAYSDSCDSYFYTDYLPPSLTQDGDSSDKPLSYQYAYDSGHTTSGAYYVSYFDRYGEIYRPVDYSGENYNAENADGENSRSDTAQSYSYGDNSYYTYTYNYTNVNYTYGYIPSSYFENGKYKNNGK